MSRTCAFPGCEGVLSLPRVMFCDQHQVCQQDGCDAPAHANRLCPLHYSRARQGLPPDGKVIYHRFCKVPGCGRDHLAKDMCSLHYEQQRRAALPQAPPVLCVDCRVDISERGHRAERCEPCQERHKHNLLLRRREVIVQATPERVCVGCGGVLAKSKRAGAVFCTRDCKNLHGQPGFPICDRDNCERPAAGVRGGLCGMHAARKRRGADMDAAPGWMMGRVCSIDGCARAPSGRGMCPTHWTRWRKGDRGERLARPIPERRQRIAVCLSSGCDRTDVHAQGLCGLHYKRYQEGRPVEGDRRCASECAVGTKRIRDHPTKGGYVQIKTPCGWVGEHRHVMTQHIGRTLLPSEHVHHINGVRGDNRVENLELWDTSHPSGQRWQDKLGWAREIVERYGDWDQLKLFVA